MVDTPCESHCSPGLATTHGRKRIGLDAGNRVSGYRGAIDRIPQNGEISLQSLIKKSSWVVYDNAGLDCRPCLIRRSQWWATGVLVLDTSTLSSSIPAVGRMLSGIHELWVGGNIESSPRFGRIGDDGTCQPKRWWTAVCERRAAGRPKILWDGFNDANALTRARPKCNKYSSNLNPRIPPNLSFPQNFQANYPNFSLIWTDFLPTTMAFYEW